MINPYFTLAGVLAIAAAAAGGYVKGSEHGRFECKSEKLDQLAKALSDRDAKDRRIGELERAAAEREHARQSEVRSIYVEVPKIVSRPVYRNQCIDADGVRLLDRAQAAAAGSAGAHPGPSAGEASAGAGDPAHH